MNDLIDFELPKTQQQKLDKFLSPRQVVDIFQFVIWRKNIPKWVWRFAA
jgi:hypothetical protein